MDYKALADKLFPDVSETVEELIARYPSRKEWQMITRFAPSPTWFLHLGWIFAALIPWLVTRQNGGVFMLRIEDTDQQRKVENGISFIVNGLAQFGIVPDEWRLTEREDTWTFWPYLQSERLSLYHAFAKHLISLGYAYPCWMTADEIDSVRQWQRIAKQPPGVYGNYSVWRNASMEDIDAKLSSAEPFVIRLKSPGLYGQKKVFLDEIRGEVFAQEHFMDSVLIKSDSYPTYHMAHLTDDTLMWTTHVVRAEEWLPSVPLHVELFELAKLPVPVYAHLAQLLKTEDGKKRKLSKRKDPEADVKWLLTSGLAAQGILEYLMTIVSPRYEIWQQENADKHFVEHDVSLTWLNKSGALVDMMKMEQVNREYLARLSNERLYDEVLAWVKTFSPEWLEGFVSLLESDKEYMIAAIGIERHTEKDPKRFVRYGDVYDQIKFFNDAYFAWLGYPDFSEKISVEDAKNALSAYLDSSFSVWDDSSDVQSWFAHLKEFGQAHGFAVNNKQFKEGWRKGKVGDLAMLLRVALCKAQRTPDLFSVMQVMGEQRVKERLKSFVENL